MDNLIALVKMHIKGDRKGMNVPNYQHSIDVYEMLRDAGYNYDIYVAGLFHDMIEDGGMTIPGLKDLGLSDRIVQLVSLCSHNGDDHDTIHRWKCMMDSIIDSGDVDAFIVKLADIADNMMDCQFLSESRRTTFVNVKGAFFAYHGYRLLNNTPLYTKFLETYYDEYRRLNGLLF